MKNVWVIIVTYQGMEFLPKCLENLKNHPVIIIDNNSTDGTIEFITTNYPDISLFKNKENLGFGKANNVGLKYALERNADYVFLLNQDAYLDSKVIAELINFHQKNKKFGVLSPVHLNGKGDRLDANFSRFMGYDGNKDFYSDFVLNKDKKEVYEVPFVNAAGWLVSRECLEKVGGFDPMFYHYGEDENYCQRVRFHGFKIGVMPGYFLRHDRENRPVKNTGSKFSRFESNEKDIKIKYANINEDYDDELENLMYKRKKFKKLSYLKFKFKDASFYKREYEYLKELVTDIKQSRRIAKEGNMPYLNI